MPKCPYCQAKVLLGDKTCEKCGSLVYITDIVNIAIYIGLGIVAAIPLSFFLTMLLSVLYNDPNTSKIYLRTYIVILFIYIAYLVKYFMQQNDEL